MKSPGIAAILGEAEYWMWQPGDATRYGLIVVPVRQALEIGGALGSVDDGGGVIITFTNNGRTWMFPKHGNIMAGDLHQYLGIHNGPSMYQVMRALKIILGAEIPEMEQLKKELLANHYNPEAVD